MNKSLLAFPFAVCTLSAVAFAATSQFSGEQTKQEYELLLAQLNALSVATFVNESYETGVGKSTAITRVQNGGAGDSDVLLFLHHDIDHSAVRKDDDGLHVGTVSIDTTLHQQDFAPEEMLEMFKDATPFRLITDIQHTGEVRNRLTVNPNDPDNAIDEFSWDGLELDVITNDGKIVGDGKLGKLSVVNPEDGTEMSIADSPFEVDLTLDEKVNYVGTTNFVINQMNLKSPQRPELTIKQIAVASETQVNDDGVDGSLLFDVRGIQSIMPISNASLDIAINGLGVEGVGLLNELFETQNAVFDQDTMSDEILTAVKAMLQPGVLMSFDLLLNNRGGDVVTDLNIALKEEGEDGMSADALEKVVTQRDALNLINFNGLLNADRSALDITPAMLFLGAAGEYITITDESVTSSITLEGSTLNINGVLLPLDQLTGSLDQPFSDLLR